MAIDNTPIDALPVSDVVVATRNVPMIEVALQTGFADQSHFSRFFKRLIGVTPRQYAEIFGGRQA